MVLFILWEAAHGNPKSKWQWGSNPGQPWRRPGEGRDFPVSLLHCSKTGAAPPSLQDWPPVAPPHAHAQTRLPSPEQLLEGQALTPANFSELSQHITESSASSPQTQTSSQQPTPPPTAHSGICPHHAHSCVNQKALCHILVSNSPAGFVDLSPKCL